METFDIGNSGAHQSPSHEGGVKHGRVGVFGIERIVETYREWLYMPEDASIRTMVAAYLANRYSDAKSLWMFFVAPSSSAKTELLEPFEKLADCYQLSDLTVNTLLSGFVGKDKYDPSLLPRLNEAGKRVLIHRDFTTVLSMRSEDRMRILAQIREVADGKYSKDLGNSEPKHWEGKVGMMAAVTNVVEEVIMLNSQMGDRYLYCRLPAVDQMKTMAMVRSVRASAAEDAKERVAGMVRSMADSADFSGNVPDVPDSVYERLAALSIAAVTLRRPVDRDRFTREILSVAEPEGVGRLMRNLLTLCGGFAAMRGGTWDGRDMDAVSDVALGGVPRSRMNIVRKLAAAGGSSTTKELAPLIGLTARTLNRQLEDLMAVMAVERRLVGVLSKDTAEHDENQTYLWSLTGETAGAVRCAAVASQPPPGPF